MSSGHQGQQPQESARAGNLMERAWLSVALIPVFLVVNVVLQLFLYESLGYKPENDNAPWWVDLLIGIVTLAVFLVPCAAAVLYGRRANRVGDRRGRWPLGIGALAGLLVTVMTLLSIVGPIKWE